MRRCDDLLGTRNRQLPERRTVAITPPDDGGLGSIRRDFRKEGSQAPELFALPARERVIVALGTFQPYSQKNASHAGGEILRLSLLGKVIAFRRRAELR